MQPVFQVLALAWLAGATRCAERACGRLEEHRCWAREGKGRAWDSAESRALHPSKELAGRHCMLRVECRGELQTTAEDRRVYVNMSSSQGGRIAGCRGDHLVIAGSAGLIRHIHLNPSNVAATWCLTWNVNKQAALDETDFQCIDNKRNNIHPFLHTFHISQHPCLDACPPPACREAGAVRRPWPRHQGCHDQRVVQQQAGAPQQQQPYHRACACRPIYQKPTSTSWCDVVGEQRRRLRRTRLLLRRRAAPCRTRSQSPRRQRPPRRH